MSSVTMRCPRRIAAPPIRAHSVQRVRNSNDARHQRNLRTLQAVGIAATIHVFVAQLDARQHVLKLRNGAHDIGALYGVLLHQAELFPELARRGVVPFFRLYPHTRQTIGGVVSFGKNSATPPGFARVTCLSRAGHSSGWPLSNPRIIRFHRQSNLWRPDRFLPSIEPFQERIADPLVLVSSATITGTTMDAYNLQSAAPATDQLF